MHINDPQTHLGARVLGSGRLSVAANTRSVGEAETSAGFGYNVNPGDITLTSANESALLYMTNTGSNPLVIDAFIFIIGTSTGGVGTTLCEVYRNPTTGTLLSGTTVPPGPQNRDFGSSQSLSATQTYGAEASTVVLSDGVNISSRTSAPGRLFLSVGTVVLAQGNSVAMAITPPPSNTSMVVQCAMQVYENAEGTL